MSPDTFEERARNLSERSATALGRWGISRLAGGLLLIVMGIVVLVAPYILGLVLGIGAIVLGILLLVSVPTPAREPARERREWPAPSPPRDEPPSTEPPSQTPPPRPI